MIKQTYAKNNNLTNMCLTTLPLL